MARGPVFPRGCSWFALSSSKLLPSEPGREYFFFFGDPFQRNLNPSGLFVSRAQLSPFSFLSHFRLFPVHFPSSSSSSFASPFSAGRRGGVPQAAATIAGAGLTAKVHLSLSVKNLQNLDAGSLSDPFVVSVFFLPLCFPVADGVFVGLDLLSNPPNPCSQACPVWSAAACESHVLRLLACVLQTLVYADI